MRVWLCLLLAMLLLSGCAAEVTPPTTTAATRFPVDKTPMDLLGQSVENILRASSFMIEYVHVDHKGNEKVQFSIALIRDTRGGYLALQEKPCGCGMYVSSKTAVRRNCEDGSVERSIGENAYDLAYLLQDLPTLDRSVMTRFCSSAMTANPDPDGSIRFETKALDQAQMEQLLGVEMDVAADFVGFFAMVLDAAGNLAQVEYTEGTVIHRISITAINQKIHVNKPEWA